MQSLSKRLSFPRRREYTLQGFGIAVRTDWIPAFAGMTAPWTADDWQMKTVHEEENPHSPAQVTPPLPLPFYCRGQFYGLQKVLPLADSKLEVALLTDLNRPVNGVALLKDSNLRRHGLVAPVLLSLAATAAAFPFQLRAQNLLPAPGGAIVQLTPQPGYFTEPSIAINPGNPEQIVAAYQDNAHVATSSDAGAHWMTPPGIAPPDYRVSGDVSVTYDTRGHAILCYIAFDKLGTFNYWAHGAMRNGIFIRRSLDGGRTWEANHIPVAEQPTQPGIPFEDKPYIVADTSSDPHAGNLYIGWTRWTLEDSRILLSRSTDGGATWLAPLEISVRRGLPRDDNGAAEGFSGAVGADGTLYVVWALGDHIIFRASSDGGASFTPERDIIRTAPIMFHVQDVSRANGFPVIAVDPGSGSPRAGQPRSRVPAAQTPRPRGGRPERLYVAWSDYRHGDVDVFCSASSDRGRTWSEPVRVNSDPLHNGADQFFHWLAADPADGSANLIYYDRRLDPGNRDAAVTLARSTDGGKSFTNYAWATEAFNPGGIFMGDYTGIAAFGGK
ncbi:MAG: hypothetical protein DMG21_21850, partial [Acidobacteria bacterium]